MNKRFCSLSFLFVAGVIAANAQWTSQDSLKLQKFLSGEKELKLNAEEIGNIRLESPSLEKPFDLSPLMDTEKPSLKFKTNLPTYFTDSIPRKRRIYLTLHPYGIFTGYDENPVTGQSYIYPMAVKFSLRNGPVRNYKVTTPLPGIGGRVLAPIGPGISYSFSAEDLLQRIFSKKAGQDCIMPSTPMLGKTTKNGAFSLVGGGDSVACVNKFGHNPPHRFLYILYAFHLLTLRINKK